MREEHRGRGGEGAYRALPQGARGWGGGMASEWRVRGGVDVGARGRAGGAPDSTESRVCGKGGHDCEWQLRCGQVLILCLSLKSSLWRGAAYINHLRRRSIRGYDETRYAVAIRQPVCAGQGGGRGHKGGRRSSGVWRRSGRRGRVTSAASMLPRPPPPPRGPISSTSKRSEPQ